MTPLETVQNEIDKYEHPMFAFSARETEQGVEMLIHSKVAEVHSPEYHFPFAPRDITSTQFPWTFQKILYDCLTDYMVELFTQSPMTGNQ